MDKVITINFLTSKFKGDENFIETEYPKLKEFLEQGFHVLDKIPFTNDTGSVCSITFILRKSGGMKQG